jgi:outer membrane biogenesis lipoprotein LolB
VALDQLDGQARFTNTTTADNYQLILSQELGRKAANVSYTEQAKARTEKGDKKNTLAKRLQIGRTYLGC